MKKLERGWERASMARVVREGLSACPLLFFDLNYDTSQGSFLACWPATPLQGSSVSTLTPGFLAEDTEEAISSGSSGNQLSSVPRAPGQASSGPWLLPKPHPPEISARTPSPLWPPMRGPWRGRPPFDQGHRAEFTERVQQIELPRA